MKAAKVAAARRATGTGQRGIRRPHIRQLVARSLGTESVLSAMQVVQGV